MRPVVAFLIMTVIVGTLALPHAHYSGQGSPYTGAASMRKLLKLCKTIGSTCRDDFDCCGAKTICRILPAGGFSMTFRCDYRGFGFFR
ncbi:Hypothetical protein NTJ_08673 [Nesidiocoris tenuis]|uniref:Uncharacterized protein n=1 Tax=Nesidiocoris tenuis TaxID=355587 RepID=A0ABN7AX42_9HEMI|nr:Hypothetical protein NTJ_08673 [Nesidiocoris tenuis]